MFIIDNKYKKIRKLLVSDKSLVIFDIEATGQNISQDKIIEIAYIKILENGATKESDMIINPEMKVSPEATAVHGITNEMVKDKPTFRKVANELWSELNGCYYAGFNIKNFDLPVLRREFIRVGLDFEYNSDQVIDAREIFRYMQPRSLSFAYRFYCGKELKLGHTAPLNAQVATDILIKQLEKYKEVRDLEFIQKINRHEEEDFLDVSRKFYWRRGEAYFSFSKYKDWPLSAVVKEDRAFLEWILAADFSEETKEIVRQTLSGKEVRPK